ncbi:LysR family transcriptional regulator [Sphingomonas endolithica]|uniref:LysR family transcriptional regulator n=1 Tax=Sphingomonas endolithica TaxID=2972485 RepID=UPI0021AF8F8D|nr:LysR family transcriptional regulator [Sphingomonas sp. ZFBP2030]
MNSEPSWDLYRTFAAVLREGSLSGAARVLRITQPSVSRHIEALEQAVGGALFVRSQRGLSPTDRATALGPYAEELVATSAAFMRSASATVGEVAGTVRVSASEIVAVEHLPSMLAGIRQDHPQLAIELVASNALDDLLQRRADIAVRMVAPEQQALVATRAGSVTLGLHARQDYLARRGMPAAIDDLAGHDLIGPDTDTPGTRAVLNLLPELKRASFALRVDSDVVQLAAIRSGFGIGVCQVEIARRDPLLVRVLPQSLCRRTATLDRDARGPAQQCAMSCGL